jgi:heat shock protein 4
LQNCKNALEEYVYDTRSKLDDRYAAYVQSEEKGNLLVALQHAEDWLYTEEGEEAPKSQYVARLETLHKLGDPVYNRWKESDERPRAASTLRETINQFLGQGQGTIDAERYSHIDEKDKQSVVEKAVLMQQWLDDQMARQAEKPKNTDPILKAEDVMKKRDELIYFATPLMSKPKPKPTIPDGTASGTQTPKESGQQTPKGDEMPMEEKPQPPEMDVD